MLISQLTMPEFEAAMAKTETVVIPFGSVEEHGPHLPLSTDTMHAQEVAARLAKRCPMLVAAPVHYGICRSTREHPGTISISGDALRTLALDLGREFYRQGCRRLILLTGHAGGTHVAALIEAGERLLVELPDLKIAVVNILQLLQEVLVQYPGLVHTPGDSHAGEVETAIMLAARPELVSGKAPAEWPRFSKFVLVRRKRKFWPGGVWGDPTQANAEQGEQILNLEVQFLLELLNTMNNMED
ncbi:MAG TPA: creatininase [Desulfobacterales bacterium]|nr:creatininase [Desulfobacterales bacterium]